MASTATSNGTATTPEAIVRTFLDALVEGDVDHAVSLLAEDAVWINVSLPTVHGRRSIERLLRLAATRLGMGFRVQLHNVAADGAVVLTERTDALGAGRFEQRFWVYGRFEVRDGRIAVWRDSFDWLDITVSLARALAGTVVPRLNRRWPG